MYWKNSCRYFLLVFPFYSVSCATVFHGCVLEKLFFFVLALSLLLLLLLFFFFLYCYFDM